MIYSVHIRILLLWAVIRLFQHESHMAMNCKAQEKVVLFLQILYPKLKNAIGIGKIGDFIKKCV